jgi:HSP20 family protein
MEEESMSNELEKREKKEVTSATAEPIAGASQSYWPDTDVCETENELIFRVDLPGVAKGNVKIEVDENNILVVRAQNTYKDCENILLRQFPAGDYFRAFSLGDVLDKEKISAHLENGLLEIRIPQKEEAKPKRIAITA